MTYGMSIEDKLDNWAKYSTAGQKQVLQEASTKIRELLKHNKSQSSDLLQALADRDREKARGDLAMEFIHMAMQHVDVVQAEKGL